MATPSGDAPATTQKALEHLRPFYPGWPDSALRIVAERWVDHGDINLALAEARASDEYDAAFPGMVREDGSLRFGSEQEYFNAKTQFDATLMSMGIDPTHFQQTYIDNLEAEVSVREQINRAEQIFAQVVDRAPELRAWYARPENGGMGDMTTEAILASALDPRVGEEILNRRIGIAEIGAQATIRDVDVDFELIERLYEVGTSVDAARQTFGAAAEVMPVLNVLTQRHNDPDDDFDINEFVGAQVLDDPFQRRRMRRLLAQERASFADSSGFITDRGGAVRGLQIR